MKIQFLKTFVLPVFDYCLSLSIYYSQKAIQKLSNCYYLCLYKLLKVKAKIDYRFQGDFNRLNDRLSGYGLLSFQHRALTRLLFFSHKLINNALFPRDLNDKLLVNNSFDKHYNLRNNDKFFISCINYESKFKEVTFSDFIAKLINNLCHEQIKFILTNFKNFVYKNLNFLFLKFVNIFEKFNLTYNLNFFI